MDVAFEVVDGDEGFREAEGEGLGVGDADEQGSGEAGPEEYGDVASRSAKVRVGAGKGFADDGDDVARRCSRGRRVRGRLLRSWRGGPVWGGDDVGECFRAGAADDGGGGLVAGGFNAEDQAGFFHLVCTPLPPADFGQDPHE